MHAPPEEKEIRVSLILIAHNNTDRFKVRLERDVFPTIAAHSAWKFQMIVIDNSDADKKPAYDVLNADNFEHVYSWSGSNIMYGPAMNKAVAMSSHPLVVYVCSNHGRMYDPTWIDDLVNPIITNPKIAMTGSHYPSCHPTALGFPSHLPQMHIQGGVFGARTEALVACPYTNDQRYIHWGSDVYQGFQLLNAGFQLHHVNTINSVWRQCISSPEQWKYVHDYSE